jgi:hypothetical protein
MTWHDWIPAVNAVLMVFIIYRQTLIGGRLTLLLDLCRELIESQRILSESEVQSHAGILAVLCEIRDRNH